jgi:hypothetical protein
MSGHEAQESELQEKVRRGFVEYAFNVAYLTLVFAAFITFARLVLASYDITYSNYWIALIDGLILGKIIMIGGVFRLGRGLEKKPLIYPTLYKTLLFSILVGVFSAVEAAIEGWWTGVGIAGGLSEHVNRDYQLILAKCLVIFVALFPFFAMKELGRVVGREKIVSLFFRKRG